MALMKTGKIYIRKFADRFGKLSCTLGKIRPILHFENKSIGNIILYYKLLYLVFKQSTTPPLVFHHPRNPRE